MNIKDPVPETTREEQINDAFVRVAGTLVDSYDVVDLLCTLVETLQQGFRAAHATPLRLHGDVIGVMNLLRNVTGALNERDAKLAQALADVATIGILHERNFRQPELIATQLHRALDTRILVEQAKGVLAQLHTVTIPVEAPIQRTETQYSRNAAA